MPIPEEIQQRVAHIDLLIHHAFHRSISYWRNPDDTECRWSTFENPTRPLLIGERDGLIVEGNSIASLSAPHGGVLHINGDLNSELECGGFHEIIIRGDLTENAFIRATGFSNIYIAGSVRGKIEATDSAKVWIDGDLVGSIATGSPSMQLFVTGDMRGIIGPKEKASLIYLVIGGFASHEKLLEISAIGYTQFHASVGVSDTNAGLYPVGPGRRLTPKGNSYSRWCVLSSSLESD